MPETLNRLVEKLITEFGSDNVLTSPEHLYVYSRSGKFGVNKRCEPLAVLKIKSEEDIKRVRKALKREGLQLVRNDEWDKKGNTELDELYLLLDVKEPVTIKDLEKHLAELEGKRELDKSEMKNALSFPHWVTSSMQAQNGFKEGDDDGFCVVQSYFNSQTYSSKGRLLLAKGLLKGELKQKPVLIDSLYSCTACGQCYDQISLNTLEINNAIIRARHQITEEGNEPKRFDDARDNIREYGNPAGLPSEDRTLWIEEQVEKHPYEDNPALYWPGCVTSYRLPELVESTSNILEKAGYDFGLLGEKEGCCGLLLYLSGHWDEAVANSRKVIEPLSHVKRLITNCAGCYYAFSRLYPRLGVNVPFEVLHTSQIIKEAIREEKIKLNEFKGNYTWHDPCDLGRHCNVYEPPRYVLNHIPGLNLVEASLNREHTVCCGAGGGLWMYNEELTNHVSRQKVAEALPENLDGIITGCPTCILSLRNTLRESNPKLRVMDLVKVVDRCL
jgi:heterodisulfide reductase subunit D